MLHIIIKDNFKDYVEVSDKYFRPNEVDYLLGDSSKAREVLNWKPSVDFKGLVKIMVEHDINCCYVFSFILHHQRTLGQLNILLIRQLI